MKSMTLKPCWRWLAMGGLLIALAGWLPHHARAIEPVPPAPVPGGQAPDTAPHGGGAVTRFIKVTGIGTVRSKPGEVHITFLVSTTRDGSLTALQENEKQVGKVVKELVTRGVAQANVAFSGSSLVAPRPGEEAGSPGQKYVANARVVVTSFDPSHATDIVQIGMFGGATSVLGMSFEPNDIANLQADALIEAMKDGVHKAEILARGYEVKLLYAISATEVPAPTPEPPGGTVAPPAEIPVTAQVDVVYAVG